MEKNLIDQEPEELWKRNSAFLGKWADIFYNDFYPQQSEIIVRFEKKEKRRVNIQYYAGNIFLISWILVFGFFTLNFIFHRIEVSALFYGLLLIYVITRFIDNNYCIRDAISLKNKLETSHGWFRHGIVEELSLPSSRGFSRNKTFLLVDKEFLGGIFFLCLYIVDPEDTPNFWFFLLLVLACICFNLVTAKKFPLKSPTVYYTEKGLFIKKTKEWRGLIKWADIKEVTAQKKEKTCRDVDGHKHTEEVFELKIVLKNDRESPKFEYSSLFYSKRYYMVSLLKDVLFYIAESKKKEVY